jgi:hypothetical protein
MRIFIMYTLRAIFGERRLRCEEHVEACMGIINDSMFIGKPEVKELRYRSRHCCVLRIVQEEDVRL